MKNLKSSYGRNFNATVCPYKDGYVCCFRHTEQVSFLCYLDKEMRVVSQYSPVQYRDRLVTDPKILQICNAFVLVYSTGKGCVGKDNRGQLIYDEWMETATINMQDTPNLNYASRIPLGFIKDYPGYTQRREKNWTPFEWQNQLCFLYQRMPTQQVLRFNTDTQMAEAMAMPQPIKFPEVFGTDIRGNSTAIKIDDNTYFTTFHTQKTDRYIVGYYLFNSWFPFKPVRMCKDILIDSAQWKPPGDKVSTYNAKLNVYPSTALLEDDRIMLSVGINDYYNQFVSFDIKELVRNTTPLITQKYICCPSALGDNYMLRNNLPKILPSYKGEEVAVATNIPAMFAGISGVRPTDMQEVMTNFGKDWIEKANTYNWIVTNKYQGNFNDAVVQQWSQK